jgi:nitrate/TMAO reductase-like tetraheme cytochrome c subunit
VTGSDTPQKSEAEKEDIKDYSNTWWERAFWAIGIHFPKGKQDKVHIRPRFFTILGGGVLGVFLAMVGLVEYSTSPSFCNSCHIMRPYYEAWKTSSHNFVPCVDCHYPPGFTEELTGKMQAVSQVVKYVTRTYGTKPYAEIEDTSCLQAGCHTRRLIQGKTIFKRGIIFDHRPHLIKQKRGIQLRCTSCHSQIVQGSHMTVTEQVCFICHFKGTKAGREENPIAGCPSCHQPPTGEVKLASGTFSHEGFMGRQVPCTKCHLDAVSGEGEVAKQTCVSCHGEQERLERFEDVEFLHLTHVTKHKVECFECHAEIKHAVHTTTAPLDFSCDICHTSKHTAVKDMYRGVGGRGVPEMPDPMFLAQVDCGGCHILPAEIGTRTDFTGTTYRASGLGCRGCHGEGYEAILEMWKAQIGEGLKSLKPLLAKAEKMVTRLKKTNPEVSRRARKLLADARYNYNFVKFGKGVHNVQYSEALLQVARENCKQIEELGRKYGKLARAR